MITNESPFIRFKIISQAGIGEFARVFLVHDSENRPFALKELKDKQSDKLPVLEEVNPCYNSTCENLVKIFEVFFFQLKYSMLMEYMDCTLAHIFQKFRTFDENLIGYIFREILKGVQFLHSNDILHRDLKPENIFVNKEGNVKVGDLGICAQLTRERDKRQTFAGSPLWTAPEIILSQKYGKGCDIWSIGMIFFEMLEGKPFFSNCKNLIQLNRSMISRTLPQLTYEYSEEITEFLQGCVKYDPNLRKTVDELLQLRLFTNIDENQAKQLILHIIES
jgi:serine/threonine protein kinase